MSCGKILTSCTSQKQIKIKKLFPKKTTFLFYINNPFPILKACPRGYFGNGCFEKCNDTCVGCNNMNGLCDFGCIAGWRGGFCNEGTTYNDNIIVENIRWVEHKLQQCV